VEHRGALLASDEIRLAARDRLVAPRAPGGAVRDEGADPTEPVDVELAPLERLGERDDLGLELAPGGDPLGARVEGLELDIKDPPSWNRLRSA